MPALTPLAVLALSLLSERPMHPYEMYQLMLQRRDDRHVKVRPGSLYHTVERLEREGLAAVRGTEREGNRPERTTYAITDSGRRALDDRLVEMLVAPAEEYPEFPLALSGVDNLAKQKVVELLTTRAERQRSNLELFDSGAAITAEKGVDEKYLVDLSYQRAMLRAELAWIQEFVDRLESGDLPW